MEEVKEVKRGFCPLRGIECCGGDCEWNLCDEEGDLYCAVTIMALALAKKYGDES